MVEGKCPQASPRRLERTERARQGERLDSMNPKLKKCGEFLRLDIHPTYVLLELGRGGALYGLNEAHPPLVYLLHARGGLVPWLG